MKKIFACVLSLVLCVLLLPSKKAYASASDGFSYGGGFNLDTFLEEFTTLHPNRTTKTSTAERAAALYLGEKFLEEGLLAEDNTVPTDPSKYLSQFSFTYSSELFYSNNVIGVKKASQSHADYEKYKDKTVIIGAHYDNVHDYVLTNPYTNVNYSTLSNGAYDNGSGVAVMLSLAHNLKNFELPFDTVFVAFGAEELGMYGSRAYVSSMSQEETENTLLMVNLDSIAAGDYLYLFTQDWKVPHDGYLREKAKDLGVPLKGVPFNKKYMTDPFGERVYSHIGYYSDNYYFLNAGINTAFFMSINWESLKKAGITESDKNPDIMHTSDDNYAKLTELYPDTYLLYMQYISQLLYKSLTDVDFAKSMIYSSEHSPDYFAIMNYKYLVVAAAMICIALAVFSFFYYKKLKKVSEVKIKEFMSDPKNMEKVNIILSAYNSMPQAGGKIINFTYPPRTYKPKNGEEEFTVFGKDYENRPEKPDNEGQSSQNSENRGDDNKGGNTGSGDK